MILRVSPLTPMNDQGRISPHIIKQTSDEVTEIYELGDYYFIDKIPNSPNKHNENCMVDSKENYQLRSWELKGYSSRVHDTELIWVLFTAKAEAYKEDGNYEYNRKKFKEAIAAYTEAIKVKCDDAHLNAILYTNRATAQICLG